MKKIILLLAFIMLVGCGSEDPKDPIKPNIQTGNETTKATLSVLIEAEYDAAEPFSEGFAVVGKKENGTMKYNYINESGELLLSMWVDKAFPFSEGKAVVGTFDHSNDNYTFYEYQYIDTKGQKVIAETFLGTDFLHPMAFYKGYAEVNYYDPEFYDGGYLDPASKSIVIDEKGDRLFYFDAAYYEYQFYDASTGRILDANWQLSGGDYAKNHPWMIAYRKGSELPVVVQQFYAGQNVSHVINQKGEVIYALDQYMYRLNEDYIVVENYPHDSKLIDNDGNVVLTGYNYYQEGIDGQIIVEQDDGFGNMGSFILMKDSFMPLNHTLYQSITPFKDFYLVQVAPGNWQKLDRNGQVLVDTLLNENIFTLNPIYAYEEDITSNFIQAIYYDNYDTHFLFFDSNLELLREVVGGGYIPLGENHIGLIYDGIFEVIDIKGNTCHKQKATNNLYSENGLIVGYSQNNVIVEAYEYKIDGLKITITEVDPPLYQYYTFAKNDESELKGAYAEELVDFKLYNAKGEAIKEAKALSLIEDNIYFFTNDVERTIDEYGFEHYLIDDIRFTDLASNFTSDDFDGLGPISEGKLAYKEDGKWGYLLYK